ncbi:MAG: VIT1/CCC1 transporter family protein [Nanoarchaeota archaeon]
MTVKRKGSKKKYHEHRLRHEIHGRWLKEVVFGVHDGVLTVLGFVSGAAPLLPDARIVFFTGMASMAAEGLSMGVGEYQSTCTENEVMLRNIAEEKEEILKYPKEEIKALARYFSRRGLNHWEARRVAKKLSTKQKKFLDVVLKTGRGLAVESFENPVRNATYMGIASFLGGGIPILPYAFLPKEQAIVASIALSGVTMFALGAIKCKFTQQNMLRTGTKMMLLAMATALIAYVIGEGLGFFY